MEGTPDRHEVFRSREASTSGLGARSHPPTRVPRPKANCTVKRQPRRRSGRREGERESATGVSEARSQSAPWEDNAHAHDRGREVLIMGSSRRRRSAEAVSDVVKRPVPRSLPYGAQDSVGRPRRASGESEPGTHEMRVHAIVWVAEIDRTHRASSPPEGRKARRGERALARRKSVVPTDAGRGWVEGETVRGYRISIRFPVHGLRVMSLQVLETMEGVLGPSPVLLLPAGRSWVL